MRAGRLERVRAQLRARDYAGCLLYDPINIRYALGARNMAVWTLHNAARYAFIPTEGPTVLFDFYNCAHLSEGLETVDEVRPAVAWYYFDSGPRAPEKAARWAAEVADLVAQGGANKRLAMDHCDPLGATALAGHGIEIHNGQEVMELARAIKSADEIVLMNHAIAVCETAMACMREALEPGMTENELWSILHQVNIALGGEWIETRLLASGGRTNPWFQECGDRVIRPGELVSFDTDLIGPFGYCADISRTYFCGPGRPSDQQRHLYRLAWEQIHANIEVLKPGIGFRELAERSFQMPESCRPNRYSALIHGVGLCDEYPFVPYHEDFEGVGYDGVVEPGMVLCVESYMGEVGGDEGVKLEQQVLITETGTLLLSTYPFEDELLDRQI
ncbi:MAG: aminopeptidase P family protein [Proteobacteria bacterium]|nr:aminopeptidase P family protein [Pseudomonadota bacterium]